MKSKATDTQPETSKALSVSFKDFDYIPVTLRESSLLTQGSLM